MINPVREFLFLLLAGIFRPRSDLSPWRYHEVNKTQLGTEESQDYAGPYDSELAPQNRFFMEFAQGRFSENIEFLPGFENQVWREFIIMKSSQVGVTLSILLVIVWWIAEIRKNVLYAIDSLTEARRISTARLQPLIKSCRGSSERVQAGDEGMNTLTIFLLGLVVYLLGGWSEGGWQNKSISLGVVDEADYHPLPPEGKQDNVEELRSRTKAVADARLYVISKPKTEGHVTFKNHKDGTKHICFVPCPHCDFFQELVWEQVRYEHCKNDDGTYDNERVKAEAYYECAHADCQKPIYDSDKREMMLRHRWRQTNPNPAPGRLSAHISDLYSQFPTASFGLLATEYIAALKSFAKMTTFRRDRLGKASRPITKSEREDGDIKRLRCTEPRYHRKTLPIVPDFTAIYADVQGDVQKWMKGAFLLPDARHSNSRLYISDWGHTLDMDELVTEADEPMPIDRPWNWDPKEPWLGKTCICDQGAIDEGHDTTKVRRFCMSSGGLFVPTKGRGEVQVRKTVVESEGEIDGETIITYHFDDDAMKRDLYVESISNLDKIISGKSKAMRIFLPWELDAGLVDELCSEKLGSETDRMGFTHERWKKNPSVPNDFGDALKGLFVIWYWMGPIIAEEKRKVALAAELAGKK